jgi:enterochelin esterase-like enzyme
MPLPLLVVHDGPEYAEYSWLLRMLASASAELELPPLRAALLAPPYPRDDHYSASARYARALARELLPALTRIAPTPPGREARVGMGASLGALAMLHAHRLHPATFGGLFLQSGSFFRLRSDRQESGFPRFARIARFVGSVLRAGEWPHPIPIALTCGTGEENLGNNRVVRAALARQGYPAELDEHPDSHNWVSWRDSLHPPLVSLLQRLWG